MVKDNADHAGPRLPWAGKKVRIEAVEGELSHLWRMTADNVRTSQNINVRTSVLNFVICVPDFTTAHRISMLIRDLSSTHIGRVILLILDSDGLPSGVTSWVTLRSFPIVSDLMRHHFEQITLMASGATIYSAAHIIQPLLKPDLPVYLWWVDDLPEDTIIFSRLANLCSRLIIDSSIFSQPQVSTLSLPSLIQVSPNCAISDINWGRITPWRELIAQFFDVMEYKPYLTGVNQIEIEHAVLSPDHTSANPIQALFLAAWLKARLGWQYTAETMESENIANLGVYSWSMARPTGRLTGRLSGPSKSGKLSTSTVGNIVLRPRVQPNAQAGAICSVRLESSRNGRNATFTINLEDDPGNVLTSVQLDQGSRPPRTVSIAATHKESDLLHNELEIMGRDYLYEEILNEVFELLTEE